MFSMRFSNCECVRTRYNVVSIQTNCYASVHGSIMAIAIHPRFVSLVFQKEAWGNDNVYYHMGDRQGGRCGSSRTFGLSISHLFV